MKEKEMLERRKLAKMVIYLMKMYDLKPSSQLAKISKLHHYDGDAHITTKDLFNRLVQLSVLYKPEQLCEDTLSMNWIADYFNEYFLKNKNLYLKNKSDSTQNDLLEQYFYRRSQVVTKKMGKEKSLKCYAYSTDNKKFIVNAILLPDYEPVRRISMHALMMLAINFHKKGKMYIRNKRGDRYGYLVSQKKRPDKDYVEVKKITFEDGKRIF